jgi:hypothetical protein
MFFFGTYDVLGSEKKHADWYSPPFALEAG